MQQLIENLPMRKMKPLKNFFQPLINQILFSLLCFVLLIILVVIVIVSETEYALIGVVVVLGVLLLVLLVVVWRYIRKLGDAISEPGPTTRLI